MDSSQDQSVRDQLEKLLSHPSFLSKKRLREFLNFVVTNSLSGDVSSLKESLIGVEVYGRDPSYNPKENPIVRTEARRLRRLLEEYYATDGLPDRVLIHVPKGSYVARFEFRENPSESPGLAAPPPSSAPLPKPSWLKALTPLRLVLGFLSASLIATAALTYIKVTHQSVVWSARPFSRLGGMEEFSSFSPDGQRLAFVWSGPKGNNRDIYVQDLKADSPTRLTKDPAEDTRPAWSPDGKQIAFIRLTGEERKELNLISLETGKETKVAELEGTTPWLCIIPRVSWSRDGRYLFTSESFGMGEACGVVAIDVKTSEVKRITQPPPGVVGDLEADVSPDGKQVAFLRNAGEMGGDIYTVGLDGGPVQRMTFDNRDIMGFCWNSDNKSFLAASRRGDGVVKLWQIDAGGRQARQLNDGAALVTFPVITAQGNRIAFTSYRNVTSIWRASDAASKTLLISDGSGNSNPQLSPDGSRLLFRSDRTGAFEIWTSDREGRDARRLTHFNGPMVNSPAWSPDGKQIAFECRPTAHSDICLIRADGKGDVLRFTQWTSNEILPSWSRDGRFIYFTSNYSGRWEIYKQAVEGGEPFAITHQGGMRAVESWDGRYVYVHRGQPLGGIVRIALRTTPGATPADASENKVFLGELTGGMWGNWDIGPEGVIFLAPLTPKTARSIALFDPQTGSRHTLFPIGEKLPQGDRIFAVEPNGKSFLYVKTETDGGEIGMLERGNRTGS